MRRDPATGLWLPTVDPRYIYRPGEEGIFGGQIRHDTFPLPDLPTALTISDDGLIFRDQFNASNQQLDGYNGWSESDPGSFDIVSNVVEAVWAASDDRYVTQNLGDQGTCMIQVNFVRNAGQLGMNLMLNRVSAATAGSEYQLNMKSGEAYRIAKRGSGVLGSGGSVPGTGTIVTARLVLDISPAPKELRAYSAEGISNLQELTNDLTLRASATDAAARATDSHYGMQVSDGTSQADTDLDEFFICGRIIKVTGLGTGQKIQIDSRAKVTESGGVVTIDPETWALPATTIKLLDPDDTVVDSKTPAGGIWGGLQANAA